MPKLKIINANQGLFHRYKNTKLKLTCNANIYFNKQCLENNITPTYTKLKTATSSQAAIKTIQKAQIIRIKEEIKFLYRKKQHLNNELYHTHTSLANTWGNIWEYIHGTIEADLQEIMENKYRTLNKKISKLTQEQITKPKTQQTFYPRVINNTNITFTTDELDLLNKGPKYNLHHKQKNWITKLGLETENAISLLPTEDRNYYRKQVAQKITHLHQQKNNKNSQNIKREQHAMRSIETKLATNHATIAQADKGNTLVILPTTQYQNKINDFIRQNNFQTTNIDPTKNHQKQVR
jgi:hypothetical protein